MAKIMIDGREINSEALQFDKKGLRIDTVDKLFLYIFDGNPSAKKYCQEISVSEKISLIAKQYNIIEYNREVLWAAVRRLQKEADKIKQLQLFEVK